MLVLTDTFDITDLGIEMDQIELEEFKGDDKTSSITLHPITIKELSDLMKNENEIIINFINEGSKNILEFPEIKEYKTKFEITTDEKELDGVAEFYNISEGKAVFVLVYFGAYDEKEPPCICLNRLEIDSFTYRRKL